MRAADGGIDGVITEDDIYRYASYFENIPLEARDVFNRFFEGKQSVEYYRGLLRGLSTAYVLLKEGGLEAEELMKLAHLAAYVSHKVIEEGLLKELLH